MNYVTASHNGFWFERVTVMVMRVERSELGGKKPNICNMVEGKKLKSERTDKDSGPLQQCMGSCLLRQPNSLHKHDALWELH